jgi:hypothetical protein
MVKMDVGVVMVRLFLREPESRLNKLKAAGYADEFQQAVESSDGRKSVS